MNRKDPQVSVPGQDEGASQPLPVLRGESSAGLLGNLRVVSLCVLVSRILGLARDSAMTALLGVGPVHDAFVLAFRLPNMARQIFGEGALTTAFLPVFVRELERHGVTSARQTFTAISLTTGAILILLAGVAELLIGTLLWRLPENSPFIPLLQLLAIMFPYTVLICLAALSCAALHSLRQFLWAGVVPVLLNSIWLVGVLVARNVSEIQLTQARILAIFVLGAGTLQFLVPLLALSRLGMGPIRHWQPARGRIREVYASVLPVVLGLSLTQISTVVDSALAWGLAPGKLGEVAPFEALGVRAPLESGTATALYIGQRMYQFPAGVFGVALGTVLFPVLTRHAERGEMNLFRDDLAYGMRLVIAVALPASAGLFLLAQPITSVLFHHGAVESRDALLVSRMIGGYGAVVWAFIGLAILNRGFYALSDRLTPMKLGIISLAINLCLNLTLVWTWGGMGLVVGTATATILQLLLTLFWMQRRLGRFDWPGIGNCLWRSLLATFVMSAACALIVHQWPAEGGLVQRFLRLTAHLLTGLLTYGFTAWLLRVEEVHSLVGLVLGIGQTKQRE